MAEHETTQAQRQERKEFLRSLVLLALPVAAQDLVSMLVNLVDSLMIGQLGEVAVSGVSFANQFLYLASSTCLGLVMGAVVIGTQCWGRAEVGQIKQLLKATFYISTAAALVVAAVVFWQPAFVLSVYTTDMAVITHCTVYLQIIGLSLIPQVICRVFVSMLRATKNVKFGFYNSVAACAVNTALNFILINGYLGFPALGINGAAIATLIARLVEMAIALVYIFGFEEKICFRLADFGIKVSKKLFKALLAVGIPLLGSEIVSSLNMTLQSMIIGRVHINFVAANSLVHNSYQFVQVFCRGVGSAAAIMTGNVIGRREMEQTKKQTALFVHAAVMFGIFSSIFVVLVTPILCNIYNFTAQTKDIAVEISYAASITVFCVSIQKIVAEGVIRAGGKSKIQMYVDIVSSWAVGLPVAYGVALVLKLSPFWIYLAIRTPYIIKAVWGIWYVKKRDWVRQINTS